MLRKLWHCIGAVESTGSEKRDCFLFEGWKVGAGCSIFPVVLLFLTFPRSLIHLPLDPSTTRLCLLFHPWRRPTVFVCLFLTNPPAFTPSPPHPVLLHIFLSPVVSLSSISWSSRPVQVGARVVLSFSGFTHSRYYHQTPVRLADSHLDRAVNHLADNDGRCQACARRGLNRMIHISCWTVMRLSFQMTSFCCQLYFLFCSAESTDECPWHQRMNVEYSNLSLISSIISVVSHFFSNYIIIQAMNNDLMKH